jgi:hypothetical protein
MMTRCLSPFLKPHEAIRILQALGFAEVRRKDRTSNSVTPTGGEQLCPVTKDATLRLRCCER